MIPNNGEYSPHYRVTPSFVAESILGEEFGKLAQALGIVRPALACSLGKFTDKIFGAINNKADYISHSSIA